MNREELKNKLIFIQKTCLDTGFKFTTLGDKWFRIINQKANRRIDVGYEKNIIQIFHHDSGKPYSFLNALTFEELKFITLLIDYFANLEEYQKLNFGKVTELECEINMLKGEIISLKEENEHLKKGITNQLKNKLLLSLQKVLEVKDE